jgi:hypothetical protein
MAIKLLFRKERRMKKQWIIQLAFALMIALAGILRIL